MSKSDDMRVPLNEVLGVPGFLYGRDKEQWLRENKIDVQEDWAGRESVDIPTAMRIKKSYDAQLAKIREETRVRDAENEQVREAQKRREELYGETFRIRSMDGTSRDEVLARARRDVLEAEKDLPRQVRARLTWPIYIPLVFNN